MLYLTKIGIAVLVFFAAAELSKTYPRWAGLISAMPWVTLLVIVTKHQFDAAPASEIVEYLMATFWFILPTLLFVLLMASLMHRGFEFYTALGVSLLIAMIGNGVVAVALRSFG